MFTQPVRTASKAVLFALATTFATAASHADLAAIRNYKPAALENACVIESLAFTDWLARNFPRHPARMVYFPLKAGGYHAVVLFTLEEALYLWDMDFGPMSLGLKTDSLEPPGLTERAAQVFHEALLDSATPDTRLRVRGRTRPQKITGKVAAPRNLSLPRWVYQRLAGFVPDVTLVTYRKREYVTFARERAAHVFSVDRGTLVAIARATDEMAAVTRWLLSNTYGGDGNFTIVTGASVPPLHVPTQDREARVAQAEQCD